MSNFQVYTETTNSKYTINRYVNLYKVIQRLVSRIKTPVPYKNPLCPDLKPEEVRLTFLCFFLDGRGIILNTLLLPCEYH